MLYEALLWIRKSGYEAVCIVPCRRHKRRKRAEAERPRGSVGDPETVWYPVKFFAKLFFKKAKKAGLYKGGIIVYNRGNVNIVEGKR